jgi:hypothetical protein
MMQAVIRVLLTDTFRWEDESLIPRFEMHSALLPTLFHRDLWQRDVRERGFTN